MISESIQSHRDNNRLILFTHIPKCAGTSIRESLIEPNIPEHLVYAPLGIRELFWSKRDFRFIRGHFEFGSEKVIHPLSPARMRVPFRFTVLRDPVDQMLSYYFYHRRLRTNLADREYSEHEILEYFRSQIGSQNLQTRFCAGLVISRLVNRYSSAPMLRLALRTAKHNLTSGFDYVGRFECINTVMADLADVLDLPFSIIHSEITKSHKPISRTDLSCVVLRELLEINRYDVELYEFAQDSLWNSRAFPEL